MRLVSYNIQYGLGKDGRYDLERIAGEVADADVIALQEVDRFWQRSGVVDQPAELARHLPAHHWVYGAHLDMDASFPDPTGRPVHCRHQFGTMIFSRAPIVSSRSFPLPKYGTLAQHSMQRGALEAVIVTPAGRPLRIYSIHLCDGDPPAPGRGDPRDSRARACGRRRLVRRPFRTPLPAGPRAICRRCRARRC